jgi:hypothetical protein
MRARVARPVSSGKALSAKKTVLDDFMIGHRRAVLREFAHDIKRDVVAARHPAVEEQTVQLRLAGEPYIALLGQFARQRREHGLAGLDAAAGQVLAIYVRMLDQEDAAGAIDHHGARAQRRAARETPIQMHQRPDDRLEGAAKCVQSVFLFAFLFCSSIRCVCVLRMAPISIYRVPLVSRRL